MKKNSPQVLPVTLSSQFSGAGVNKVEMLRYSFSLLFLLLFSCASALKTPSVDVDSQNNGEQRHEIPASNEAAPFISKELMKRMPKLNITRVGVLNFTALNGEESPAGKLLAEKLISELTSEKGVTVVEREQLSRIIEEQKLNMSGATTEINQEAGTVLSVDVLISGTVTSSNGQDEITAKITDVKTGEIYGAIALNAGAGTPVNANPARLPEDSYPSSKMARPNETTEERGLISHVIRAELSALKRRDPAEFKRIKKLLHSLRAMKNNKPGLFILVTEPRGSKKLARLKKNNPRKFWRLKKIRKRLFSALRLLPSLKSKLILHRRAALARLSRRPGGIKNW